MYLGDAGVEGSELQDDARSPHSGTGVGGGPLTLEQYISNAREALGVDSHYSRCVLTANLFSTGRMMHFSCCALCVNENMLHVSSIFSFFRRHFLS